MRILIITNWFPHEKNPVSGVCVLEFAKAISKYVDTVVLHYGFTNSGLFSISREQIDGINVIKLKSRRIFPYFAQLFGLFFLLLWIILNIKKIKPDVIHAHNYIPGFIALIVSKIFRIPLVITEHGLHKKGDEYRGFYYEKYKFMILREIIQKFLTKITYSNNDLVVPVSKASLENLLEIANIGGKFRIVPNVLNEKFMMCYPTKVNSQKICYIGGLNPRKGIIYLFRAVKILKEKNKNFTLEIVGGSEDSIKYYKKIANKLNIENYIVFHGFLEDNKKIEILKESKFFVLPSLYENFGIVLIEAMACGKPVVSTNAGGPKEIVSKERGILIPPEDPYKLADAMEFMLENSDKFLSKEISNSVKKEYSQKRIGRILYEIYMRVVNESSKNLL